MQERLFLFLPLKDQAILGQYRSPFYISLSKTGAKF